MSKLVFIILKSSNCG